MISMAVFAWKKPVPDLGTGFLGVKSMGIPYSVDGLSDMTAFFVQIHIFRD